MSSQRRPALPDDVFTARFRHTVEDLERWCFERTLVAEIAREQGPGYWRLALTPAAPNAASIEIVVHTERQAVDLAVAGVAHEGLGPDMLEQLVGICDAVEAARVVTFRRSSTVTGVPVSVETAAHLADGSRWSVRSMVATEERRPLGETVSEVRRYTPWVRAARPA
jgi:hypothetical protein